MIDNNIKQEEIARKKLIREIDSIEDEKNRVGRYVLLVFALVFIAASILLGILILNPQDR